MYKTVYFEYDKIMYKRIEYIYTEYELVLGMGEGKTALVSTFWWNISENNHIKELLPNFQNLLEEKYKNHLRMKKLERL